MMNLLPYIYLGAGIFTFTYFVILWKHCGHVPAFGRFWAGAGIFSGAMALIGFALRYDGLPDILTIEGIIDSELMTESFIQNFQRGYEAISIFLLIYITGMILGAFYLSFQGNKKGVPGADYVIVLGSKVNGTRPSKALMSRIKKAHEYLTENPGTKAVLTGGRGRDEEISEALCMKRALIGLGIEEERLFLEDKSTSTVENLVFAADIIHQQEGLSKDGDDISEKEYGKTMVMQRKIVNQKVLIITNDFHTLRGKSVAKVAGFGNVDSLGAPSSKIMRLNYYTRETFSWVKFGLHGIRRKLFPSSGI